MRHELKIWPDSYAKHVDPLRPKLTTVRKNDRDFMVDDEIILRCWRPELVGRTPLEIAMADEGRLYETLGASKTADQFVCCPSCKKSNLFVSRGSDGVIRWRCYTGCGSGTLLDAMVLAGRAANLAEAIGQVDREYRDHPATQAVAGEYTGDPNLHYCVVRVDDCVYLPAGYVILQLEGVGSEKGA